MRLFGVIMCVRKKVLYVEHAREPMPVKVKFIILRYDFTLTQKISRNILIHEAVKYLKIIKKN